MSSHVCVFLIYSFELNGQTEEGNVEERKVVFERFYFVHFSTVMDPFLLGCYIYVEKS